MEVVGVEVNMGFRKRPLDHKPLCCLERVLFVTPSSQAKIICCFGGYLSAFSEMWD